MVLCVPKHQTNHDTVMCEVTRAQILELQAQIGAAGGMDPSQSSPGLCATVQCLLGPLISMRFAWDSHTYYIRQHIICIYDHIYIYMYIYAKKKYIYIYMNNLHIYRINI